MEDNENGKTPPGADKFVAETNGGSEIENTSIPAPDLPPKEEAVLGEKSQLAIKLEEAKLKFRNDQTEENLKNYTGEVEKVFQTFIAEHGVVKYESLTQYLQIWRDLINFLDEKQLGSSTGYDVGRRFEIDSILDSVEVDLADKELYKSYLLSLSPYTTGSSETGYNHNDKCAESFVQSLSNPQSMIKTISSVIMESRIHSTFSHGSLSLVYHALSEENSERAPDVRKISEKQWLLLHKNFPEDCISIWKERRGPNRDATWNSALHDVSYYIDQRSEIAHRFNIEPGVRDINTETEEFQNTMCHRINDEFAVDLRKLGIDLISEIDKGD